MLELQRKKNIVEHAGELSDPKEATDDQRARLGEPRRLLTEALAADDFDAAEVQLGELRKVLEAVNAEIKTAQEAKLVAGALGKMLKEGVEALAKLDKGKIDQKKLLGLITDSDAYDPVDPHLKVLKAISEKKPAPLTGMESLVQSKESLTKAVEAAVRSGTDTIKMAQKKGERERRIVGAEFVKFEKMKALLDKPEVLLDSLRQGWPRGKGGLELSRPPRIEVDYAAEFEAAHNANTDAQQAHPLLADWPGVLSLVQTLKGKLSDGMSDAVAEIKKPGAHGN